jgi:hypothetical protein
MDPQQSAAHVPILVTTLVATAGVGFGHTSLAVAVFDTSVADFGVGGVVATDGVCGAWPFACPSS